MILTKLALQVRLLLERLCNTTLGTTLTRLCLDNNNIGTEDLRTYVSSIYNIIQHNCILFQNQYWLPCMHVDFPNPSHQIIMATLLCNRTTVNYPALPDHVWHFIFSFWQRKIFFNSQKWPDIRGRMGRPWIR